MRQYFGEVEPPSLRTIAHRATIDLCYLEPRAFVVQRALCKCTREFLCMRALVISQHNKIDTSTQTFIKHTFEQLSLCSRASTKKTQLIKHVVCAISCA